MKFRCVKAIDLKHKLKTSIMKTTYSRRYRRSASSTRENAIFKKDAQHEHTFFAAPSNQSFFKPQTAIQRKCAHCEAEDKKVSRLSSTEEEKKLQKVEDKKEEKIQRATDKKEEEKIQRQPEKKEEEKKILKMEDKKEEKDVHRAADKKEEEKKLSTKEATTSAANNKATAVSSYIGSLDGKGTALPKESQHFFGERMGYDFSHVRVHTGTEAEQSAKEVNAKAYAVDNNIVFNKGQYNPSSEEGKKLLAHELTHVAQNSGEVAIERKVHHPEEEKEKTVAISGGANKAKNKSSFGNCEGVQVQGRTDFNPVPSSFNVQGGTTRPSNACEECTAPDCITARGTIVSVFKSNPTITLPPVPGGLTPCETAAVTRFINTTLLHHEQQHFRAFKTYDGVVRTRLNFTGCQSDLNAHVQSIHDNIDAQRSNDAIAKSDALDPFVRPIPCNCE